MFQLFSRKRKSLIPTVKTLTMDKFITYITGDEKPCENWEQILSDYFTLSGNLLARKSLYLQREIQFLKNEIYIIQLCVNTLSRSYSVKICDKLKAKGFRFPFTPDTYINDMNTVVAQSKHKVLRAHQLEVELKELGSTGKPAQAEDFYENISELSKFQGYQLNPSTLTVSEYCAILKRFNKWQPTK